MKYRSGKTMAPAGAGILSDGPAAIPHSSPSRMFLELRPPVNRRDCLQITLHITHLKAAPWRDAGKVATSTTDCQREYPPKICPLRSYFLPSFRLHKGPYLTGIRVKILCHQGWRTGPGGCAPAPGLFRRPFPPGLPIVPSPSGGGLGWGRPPLLCKVTDASDFTLTPTLSLKGEGELLMQA